MIRDVLLVKNVKPLKTRYYLVVNTTLNAIKYRCRFFHNIFKTS